MTDDQLPYESTMIDVTGLTLAELLTLRDSTLAHAIRRARREAQDKPRVLAAFQNRVAPEEPGPDHADGDGDRDPA
jgi:FXSXX-COOH protein